MGKIYLDFKTFQQINDDLVCELAKKYPKMFKEVLNQDMCDIDPSFLGFVNVYYYISKIIPTNWTVIDFGCGYNAQAYYFRNHKAFIAVDIGNYKRFYFENTDLYDGTIENFLKQNPSKNRTFAICNNVPSAETDLVRNYFPNCFVYYVD